MKSFISTLTVGCATGVALLGCAGDPNKIGVTNPNHPGPAAGRVAGAGAGVVAGNVAGAVVGAGEGFAVGASAPFNNTRRVVRTWRTETTSDGRVIQVPVDTVVDQHGRPIGNPPPTPSAAK